jgi:hypothetical protein
MARIVNLFVRGPDGPDEPAASARDCRPDLFERLRKVPAGRLAHRWLRLLEDVIRSLSSKLRGDGPPNANDN